MKIPDIMTSAYVRVKRWGLSFKFVTEDCTRPNLRLFPYVSLSGDPLSMYTSGMSCDCSPFIHPYEHLRYRVNFE